jgi:L-gulonolactone oxidase
VVALVPNADTIIRPDGIKERIELDGDNAVKVPCGKSIAELNDFCAKENRTLISPTLYPLPQVGGAISTGSHGTGLGVRTFADSILEMNIVKHDGTVATVKRGDPDYDAAKVALGTFGIIHSVKLETTPDFPVFTDKIRIPVDAVLEGFDDLITSCQYLEMFWFPFQKEFLVYLMDPCEPPNDERNWLSRQIDKLKVGIQNWGGNWVVPKAARWAPSLTPRLNSLAIRLSENVGVVIEPASKAFHFQEAYPKNFDLSYAVPSEYTRRVWKEAIRLVQDYGTRHQYPVNFALHCRFLGEGSAWLGTNYGRETCVIEVATALGTPHWEEFYHEIEKLWFSVSGARPHWGKVYSTASGLKSRYERMDDFLARREAWDPERIFLNPFLEKEVFQI